MGWVGVAASIALVVTATSPATARVGRSAVARTFATHLPLAVPAVSGLGRVTRAATIGRPVGGPKFSLSRSDGNDVHGPLDLRSMRIARGKHQDTIWFTTFGPVGNSAIDPHNGNFAVLIDTNDDRKFDYGLYVFYSRRLRGLLVKGARHRVGKAPTTRIGPREFRTRLAHGQIDDPGTYRFAVFSYYQSAPCSTHNACIDAVPNRFPLVPLDYAPPSTNWVSVPEFSSDASSDLSSRVTFTTADNKAGTGVKTWTLERRLLGSGKWRPFKKGRGKHGAVDVTGKEGASYDLRIVVTDKQKNRKTGKEQRTTFPYDDRNAKIAYSSSTQATATDAFLGTISTVGFSGTDTVTFTLPAGRKACILGGPTAGGIAHVDATIGGSTVPAFTETSATAPREQLHCYLSFAGGDQLVLTPDVSSTDGFVLDGIAVKP